MSKREIPVVLITGYLGSGKTTLMQHLLSQEKRKVALIVNDIRKSRHSETGECLHRNRTLEEYMIHKNTGIL